MAKENFNILITGVGGQGLMTLVDVLTKAIFADGKDVKSSELHGLSQRGGAVAVYISMGKTVHSPLFKHGDADLIIGLDLLEGLRAAQYANKNTKFLVNNKFHALAIADENFTAEKIFAKLQEVMNRENLQLVDAEKTCEEKLQNKVLATMYLLGYAVYNNLLDIKPESVISAINKAIPEKYREMNLQAFVLANKH